MSTLGDRSKFYNRLIIAIIVAIAIGLPLYSGIMATLVLFDGSAYLEYYLGNPRIMGLRYLQYLEYWQAYAQQLTLQQTIDNVVTHRVFGPPGAALLGGGFLLFLLRAPLLDFRPFKEKESVHGSARWASYKDMLNAGVLKKKGFLLGLLKKGKYLIADGYQHILLFAPTGSGKGVGFVIPNLLFWEDSVICHDIKLENFELTSGYRSKKLKQRCFVWNPADPEGRTHCYNPIDWVSDKMGQMVDDVQKIANLILPEQEFWQNEARSLFVGVCLYLVAVPEKVKSFGEVVRTMRSDDVVYNLAVVLDTIGKKIHPVAYMNIAAFLQKADKERSGVISTLNSSLELWANPLIDTATASSDFNIQNFKKERTTVYCGVTPDNLQRLRPLLQVFYQQATDFLTRKMPQKDEPYGVLFVMDEFPSLGKMPQFETGIAYFRGYHVRLFLIVQDTQQLKGIYEEPGMNSFLSNSTYRITFAANNVETANLISQLIGNKTVRQESHNKPKFLDFNPASRTMHVSETARALLLPQEVIGLPRDEQILLIESQPPIRTQKIKYFEDSFFTRRLLPHVDVPIQEPYDPRKKKKAKDEPADEQPANTGGTPPAAAMPPAPPAPPPPPPAPPPAASSPPPPPPPPPAPKVEALPPAPPPPAPHPAQEQKPADTAAASETAEESDEDIFKLPPLPPRPAFLDNPAAGDTVSSGETSNSEAAASEGNAEEEENPFGPPIPPPKSES